MKAAIFGGAQALASAAGMANDQLDERSKKYAGWIL